MSLLQASTVERPNRDPRPPLAEMVDVAAAVGDVAVVAVAVDPAVVSVGVAVVVPVVVVVVDVPLDPVAVDPVAEPVVAPVLDVAPAPFSDDIDGAVVVVVWAPAPAVRPSRPDSPTVARTATERT